MKRICLIAAAATLFAAPAFAEDTITVGFTASQTGPLNVDSLGQQRGYEFWRDEVNAAGGIKVAGKSYKVNFVSYDDQSVGGRVQQLYTRLVVQDKADFLFSPYSSGLTAPATVISEQYGKVMIVSGGAEEKPFLLGNKHLFMVITSATHYLSGAVEALKAKNPQSQDRHGLFRRPVLEDGVGGGGPAGQGRRPRHRDERILRAVDHRFRPDRQQDHLIERGRVPRRRPLFRWRHAGSPDVRPEGQHEMGVDPGGAGRRQIRRARGARLGRHRAVAMGDPGLLQAAVRPDHRGIRQSLSRRNSTPSPTITRRRAIPAASSCSTPSNKPAPSIRKKSPKRSTQSMSPRSSATSSSPPIRATTGCRRRTRWCWRSGKRSTASRAGKWFGRRRRNPPI